MTGPRTQRRTPSQLGAALMQLTGVPWKKPVTRNEGKYRFEKTHALVLGGGSIERKPSLPVGAPHENHLAQVASAHPDLATKYTIGQSWKKTKGQGGHDVQALCLTKKQTGDCTLSTTSP